MTQDVEAGRSGAGGGLARLPGPARARAVRGVPRSGRRPPPQLSPRPQRVRGGGLAGELGHTRGRGSLRRDLGVPGRVSGPRGRGGRGVAADAGQTAARQTPLPAVLSERNRNLRGFQEL